MCGRWEGRRWFGWGGRSGRDRGRESYHGAEECVPAWKDDVSSGGAQMFEDAASRAEPGHRVAPGPVDELAEVMQGEGEEVEDHEDGRERRLAVAEVVLEVVAVVLENVEALVLDLPARPAAGREFGDVIPVDREVGDEAVAVGQLALGVGDLDLQPVDRHGVIGTSASQR